MGGRGGASYACRVQTCMLFQAYAEHYITDGLLSGIVTQRSSIAAASDSAQASSTSTVSAYDAGAAGAMSWMNVPPPPTPPNLRTWALDPPPSPPPVEFEATKIIVSVARATRVPHAPRTHASHAYVCRNLLATKRVVYIQTPRVRTWAELHAERGGATSACALARGHTSHGQLMDRLCASGSIYTCALS